MLRANTVLGQCSSDGVARRVVFAVALRHRAPHHHPDPLPNPPHHYRCSMVATTRAERRQGPFHCVFFVAEKGSCRELLPLRYQKCSGNEWIEIVLGWNIVDI